MTSGQDFHQTTITATGASAAFTITVAGIFAAKGVSSNWNSGTVDLQVLLDDGATWVNVGTSTNFSANAYVSPLYLVAGQYRWNAATTTTAVMSVQRCGVG